MRLGIKFATVVGLALHGCAIPARNEREWALNITLSQVKDTRIKATVQNTSGDEVTFVHLNFLLDRAPVKKVTIYRKGDLKPTPVFLGVTDIAQTRRLSLKASNATSGTTD